MLSFWNLLVAPGFQHTRHVGFSEDIVVSFRTAYFEQGNLVLDSRAIACHYLRRWRLGDAGGFHVFFVSCFFCVCCLGGLNINKNNNVCVFLGRAGL